MTVDLDQKIKRKHKQTYHHFFASKRTTTFSQANVPPLFHKQTYHHFSPAHVLQCGETFDNPLLIRCEHTYGCVQQYGQVHNNKRTQLPLHAAKQTTQAHGEPNKDKELPSKHKPTHTSKNECTILFKVVSAIESHS